MKTKYTYIIYVKPEIRQFNGILGKIDLYKFQILLAGGKFLLEETYDGKNPIEWYTSTLKEQGISIRSHKQQKYKGQTYIWLEVDEEKTPVCEFMTAEELKEDDKETLAWKSVYYPCEAGTKKECLGFAVLTREKSLAQSKTIYLNTVLEGIMSSI